MQGPGFQRSIDSFLTYNLKSESNVSFGLPQMLNGVFSGLKYYSDILSQYKEVPTPKTTFNFTDVQALFLLPWELGGTGTGNSRTSEVPGLTLISLSEHRDNYPVTALGRRGISGFVSGHSLTAGSLGFTIFDRDPFYNTIVRYAQWSRRLHDVDFIRPHDLPPMDLLLTFVNSEGNSAVMYVRSLKILDTSTTLGVDSIKMTSAYSFMSSGVSTFICTEKKAEFTEWNSSRFFGTSELKRESNIQQSTTIPKGYLSIVETYRQQLEEQKKKRNPKPAPGF